MPRSLENNSVGVEELEDEKGPIAKKMLLGDDEVHVPQCEDTPTTLMQNFNELHKEVGLLKKKLKTSKQTSQRLKTKVKSLKTVVKQLREKLLISSSCEEMLCSMFLWPC